MLASLYTLRIFAGGLAAQIELTAWMLAYSLFFFTSLAFLKRYIEISGAEPGKRLKNRDYREQDRRVVESLGTSSGLLAVLVFALYINSGALKHYSPLGHLSRPHVLGDETVAARRSSGDTSRSRGFRLEGPGELDVCRRDRGFAVSGLGGLVRLLNRTA